MKVNLRRVSAAGRAPTLRLRGSRSPWVLAFHHLGVMLGNASISAVAAVTAAYVIDRGNVFTWSDPVQQSRTSFMMGTLLTTHLLASVFTASIYSARFTSQRFGKLDNRRPRFLMAIRWVLRGTLVHYVVSAMGVLLVGLFCSALPPFADKFKLEYYLEAIIDQYFSSACDAYVRHILRTESVTGQEKERSRSRVASQGDHRPKGPFQR